MNLSARQRFAGAGMLLEACKSDSGEQKAAVKKSSLNTLNVALIGYGEEGKILLESLLNIEGVKLVGLVRHLGLPPQ